MCHTLLLHGELTLCCILLSHKVLTLQKRSGYVGSNHHLVTAHIKLHLKRTVTQIRLLKWFDVSKVKDSGIRPVVQYQDRKRKQKDWLSGDMWTTTKYLISLLTNLDPLTV